MITDNPFGFGEARLTVRSIDSNRYKLQKSTLSVMTFRQHCAAYRITGFVETSHNKQEAIMTLTLR